MKKVVRSRRLAVFLAHATLAGAIALPLLAAVIWVFWDDLATAAAGNLRMVYDVTSLGTGARLAGFTLFLCGALIQAYGLLGLRQTFKEAAQERPLSSLAIKGFRRFAHVSLIMVFVAILQHTGLIVILSISDPAHQEGALTFRLGSNELKALFMALLLVFVSHVFMEGKQAKEENDAFL